MTIWSSHCAKEQVPCFHLGPTASPLLTILIDISATPSKEDRFYNFAQLLPGLHFAAIPTSESLFYSPCPSLFIFFKFYQHVGTQSFLPAENSNRCQFDKPRKYTYKICLKTGKIILGVRVICWQYQKSEPPLHC